MTEAGLPAANRMSHSPLVLHLILLALALGAVIACVLVPPLWVLVAVAALGGVALVLRYPVFGLCLLAFSIPWGGGFPVGVAGAPLTSTEAIVAPLLFAWIVSGLTTRRFPLGTRLWLPYVALFLVAIIVSASQAADTHASLREILKWIEVICVYLVAVWFIRTRGQLRVVVDAIVVAGVSQAALGFIQFIFGLGPAAFIVRGNLLRAYGTFDQPNPYAGYLNMVFPIALMMGVLGVDARRRPLYLWSAFVIAGAVFISESRGAFLAGVAANSVLLAYVSWRYRLLAGTGVVAALAGGLAGTFNLLPTGPFLKVLGAVGLGNVSFGNVTNANFSAVERAAHWLAGVRMFATHPLLGVGIGNYAVAYPRYHPRGWYDPLEHAHNFYINIAAEAGVLGLLTYLLMMGSALWYSYAILCRLEDRLSRAAVLGALGALIATSFHNLFDVLYVHGLAALLGLLMAFVAVAYRIDGESPAQVNGDVNQSAN